MINQREHEKMSAKEPKKVKSLREIIRKTKILPKKIDKNILVATSTSGNSERRGRNETGLPSIHWLRSTRDSTSSPLRNCVRTWRISARVSACWGPYWKLVFNDPA